jgi:hypothetical protein
MFFFGTVNRLNQDVLHTCFLLQICCPVFHSGEWIVVCFHLKNECLIDVLCRKSVFNDVKKFCWSLGINLDNALEKCQYQRHGFSESTALSHFGSPAQPNESMLAAIYFLDNFTGSPEAAINKMLWVPEKVW